MKPVTRDEVLMLAKRASLNRQEELSRLLFEAGGCMFSDGYFGSCDTRKEAREIGVKLANALLLDGEAS